MSVSPALRRCRFAPGPICAGLCVALAACSTPEPSSQPADAAPASDQALPPAVSPSPAFERSQRETAQRLTRQGRLGEASLAWEVLTVLRPELPEYHERLAETRRQIDAQVAERLQRAAQAQKRGELDTAAQQYLAVLALQPDQAQAADALRAIERERNKRNFLGKFSRNTLLRRGGTEAVVEGPAPGRSTGGAAAAK